MNEPPLQNELYLAVIPLVHYSTFFAGETYEEVMTLLPARNFATEFPPDKVDDYIRTFTSAAMTKFVYSQAFNPPPRTGTGFASILGSTPPPKPKIPFTFEKRTTEDGRVYVVVTQNG
jgi:hypothetical protein